VSLEVKSTPFRLLVLLAALQIGGCSITNTLSEFADEPEVSVPENDPELNTDANSVDAHTADQQNSEAEAVAAQVVPDLWQRLRSGFTIQTETLPNRVSPQRKRYLKNPRQLQNLFTRAEPYIFHVTQQLDQAGLPLELALLPIVESGYDPLAYSHSHAVGLWQFIPSTAKSLGLERNRWYDGRRDVIKSTQAAVKYLSYLHQRFDGDWLLALAAYNSGEGTVKKSIRRNKKLGRPTDFWSLKLPRETKNYVPQLLALVDIVTDPEAYHVQLPSIANSAFFDVVAIESQIEIAKVVALTGVDKSLFVRLNPAYRRSVTPPEGAHHILLPLGARDSLDAFLAQHNPSLWAPYREYQVKAGDTLSHIAQRHQLPLTLIKKANNLEGDFLRVGQILRLPPTGEIARATEYKTLATISHRVASGDTLSEIAEQYRVSIRSIKQLNNLSGNHIQIGQTLKIQASGRAVQSQTERKLVYRVRRGDSLYLIAEKFDLRIADITRWNKLDPKRYLQPGQQLKLFIDPLRI
jgi:membrane-bound lytic murein transglycosylase D